MKAFVFSLQRLLDAHEARQQACEVKVAAAARSLQNAVEMLNWLKAQVNNQISELESLREARIERHGLATRMRYLERLQYKVAQQAERVAAEEAVLDDARNELHGIVRERKGVESLKEREWRRWLEEAKRSEQREMDEFASTGFFRDAAEKAASESDSFGGGAAR